MTTPYTRADMQRDAHIAKIAVALERIAKALEELVVLLQLKQDASDYEL